MKGFSKCLEIIAFTAVIAVTTCNKSKESAEIAALAAQLQEMRAELEKAKGNAAPEEIAKMENAIADQEQRTEKRRERRGDGERGNRQRPSETETTAQTSTDAATAAPAATPAAANTTAPAAATPAASTATSTPAASTTTTADGFKLTGTTLTGYSGTSKGITIPASVTRIDDAAFANCAPSLASITFQGAIAPANISRSAFGTPAAGNSIGDLRDKYPAGGAGTYTTTSPVSNSSVWTKQ